MPAKRLTKKQMIATTKRIVDSYYKLFMDKFTYGSDSLVPAGVDKLKDDYTGILRALQRMKRK
tara:strand:- start:471 stop:659 length:189 start_codon:yes stop_codon:yes gene_type:complete